MVRAAHEGPADPAVVAAPAPAGSAAEADRGAAQDRAASAGLAGLAGHEALLVRAHAAVSPVAGRRRSVARDSDQRTRQAPRAASTTGRGGTAHGPISIARDRSSTVVAHPLIAPAPTPALVAPRGPAALQRRAAALASAGRASAARDSSAH